MRKRRDVDRIVVQKMIDYCDKVKVFINRYGTTFEDYNKDEAFQLSCSACIIQIGELTTRLSDKFKAKYASIPWNMIKSLRNIHAHEYENVELDTMWKTVTEDIPTLKSQLEEILAAETGYEKSSS